MVEAMKGLICMHDNQYKFYYLAYCGMLARFDNVEKNVKIYTYTDKIFTFYNITKVVKSKNYLIFLRNDFISMVLNYHGYVGQFYHDSKKIETYSMYRKLKRKEEIKLI